MIKKSGLAIQKFCYAAFRFTFTDQEKDTYETGIHTLFDLRNQLMQTVIIAKRSPILSGIFFVLKISLRIQ